MRTSYLSAIALAAVASSVGYVQGAAAGGSTPTVVVAPIIQMTNSGAGVTNNGVVVTGELAADGSSVTISAAGAISGVSVSGLHSGPYDLAADVMFAAPVTDAAISQTTIHNTDADIRNTGAYGEKGVSYSAFGGDVAGAGSFVGISATGAISAVSATYISAPGVVSIGNIEQTTETRGSGNIINYGGVVLDGPISGAGASVSIAASAAVSTVDLTGINFTPLGVSEILNIDQTTKNSDQTAVHNIGSLDRVGADSVVAVTGNGASYSVTATGAASSVSSSQIASTDRTDVVIGNVTQYTGNGSATGGKVISNTGGTKGGLKLIELSGVGATVSVAAVGAGSFVSTRYIANEYSSRFQAGDISQETFSGAGTIINNGQLTGYLGEGTILNGTGSSLSISAIGAISGVSATYLESKPLVSLDIHSVTQATENHSDVTNNHKGYYYASGGDVRNPQINVRRITGDGASVSLSALGAASTVSVSRINGPYVGYDSVVQIGNISQTTINTGNVTNQGTDFYGQPMGTDNVINISGSILGTGASASISATGASSSVAVATINSKSVRGTTNVGSIAQTTVNSGTIRNSGTVRVGSVSGIGASVSISATGASSAVSVSSIR